MDTALRAGRRRHVHVAKANIGHQELAARHRQARTRGQEHVAPRHLHGHAVRAQCEAGAIHRHGIEALIIGEGRLLQAAVDGRPQASFAGDGA